VDMRGRGRSLTIRTSAKSTETSKRVAEDFAA
jgi:hypothetical protein